MAARRKRTPSEDELRLWRHAMRGTIPFDPGNAAEPAAMPQSEQADAPSISAKPQSPPVSMHASPVHQERGAGGVDRRTIQRLRRGQMPVDGRLDLHGLTQSEAHERLTSFLAVKQRQGARCLLVITGRGARYGGVLRQMTPRWLNEPPNRDRVLAHTTAQTRHGGDGALYVLLRRRR